MIGMKILPTLTVLMMNIIMIWRLSQLKLRKRYAKSSKFTSKQQEFFKKGEGEVNTISKDVTKRTEKRLSRKVSKLIDEIRIGRILILISSFYILLTLPHTIDQFHYLLYKTDNYEKRFYGLDEILASLSYLALTVNYSLNFYFYCLINQDIRKDVKNFINKYFNTCS